MLKHMKMEGVGPAASFDIEFSKRLNFLTGDNGLGKTLFLDAAWWGLTRTWSDMMLRPRAATDGVKAQPLPRMQFQFDGKSAPSSLKSNYDRRKEIWLVPKGRPSIPGLVIYSQVTGGSSIWDPARNYWKGENSDRPASFLFTAKELWEGNAYCEGLIRDWASWQLENGNSFQRLKRVLEALSPSPDEVLVPGELRKISINDPKKYPTLKMPYGQEVPVIHASAGMRRILALAYLLVWTWQEHLAACEIIGSAPAKEIIFIIDEVEAHLHPQWQRRIVPALLAVMDALTDTQDVATQLICSTHSPLILASVETAFDPDKDAIFTLDMEDGEVQLERFDWHKKGDANSWLTSTIFDLAQPRSLEAERAIEDAFALLREENPALEEIEAVDAALANALPVMDPFFIRWSAFVDRARGVED